MQNQGYFVWKKEHQNYLMTDLNFQVLNPNIPLKISTIAKEQRSMSLQAIWCQKTGFINRNIGQSESMDQQIAEEIDVW